jgi:Tol biopolymer transport system component
VNARDDFDLRLTDMLDDLAAARVPEYLADIHAVARRRQQRPSWSFPGRWLPLDLVPVWPGSANRFVWMLVVVALIAAAAALVQLGSQRHLPAPFGPAGNGRIVYDDGSRILSINPDGSDVRPLTSVVGTATRPSFSLDGLRLAFLLDTDGRQAIVVANADGSNPIEVASTDEAEGAAFAGEAPAWSPDSTRVAISVLFLQEPGLEHVEIWIVNTDGTGHTVLPTPSLVSAEGPSWSPTGDRLAFIGEPSRMPEGFLYVSALDGSGLVRISERASSADAGYLQVARWSPDGRQIAVHYGDLARTGRDVLLLATDPINEEVVAGTVADEAQPAWSPDGSQLAYWRSTVAGANRWQVVILDIVQATERVLSVRSGNADSLNWSPDGDWVSVAICPVSVRCELRLLDATGAGREPVVLAAVPPKSYDVSHDLAYWSWQRLAP